ncbi:MAG TPA: hypothetical protein VGL80_28570 [Pseudonocardiaceae bacterium]
MRFRPYLAVAGCAAAVVLATAVPAMAASAPSTTATAPTRDSQPLPVKCPADAAGVKVAIAKAAKDGKRVDIVEACRQLLEKSGAIPKGAPETGGGGMAAEVGSWG